MPTRLHLVRHGDASDASPDSERPLSERGAEDVEALGHRLAAQGVRVAEIRHSGLLRASQTAAILARHLRPPRGVRAAPGFRPDDDDLAAAVMLAHEEEDLLLVSHMPLLPRVAARLVGPGAGLRPFQTAECRSFTAQGAGDLGCFRMDA